nr:phage tail spike protein [Shimazuella soli]
MNADGVAQGILSNDIPSACPFWDDTHTERLEHGLLTLEFTIPANHPSASLFTTEGYIMYPTEDGEWQLLQIKEITDQNQDRTYTKQIFCENAAVSDLLGQIVRPASLNSQTIEQIFTYVLQGTGWSLRRTDYAGVNDFVFDDYITSLEAVHKILDVFGAEIVFRVDFNGLRISQKWIDVVQRRGQDTKKMFVYGLDLVDVERVEDTKDLVTALIAVGQADANGNPLTFAGYTPPVNTNYEKVNDWVGSTVALQQFGKNGKHIFGVYKDDQATNAVELYNNTIKKLDELSKPRITYTVNVVLLEQLTGYEAHRVRLGDTIRVQDTTFQPDLLLEARIIEKKRSLSDPTQNSVTLGEFIPIAPSSMEGIKRIQSIIQQNQSKWDTVSSWATTDTNGQVVLDGQKVKTNSLPLDRTAGGTMKLTANDSIVMLADDETPVGQLSGTSGGFSFLAAGQIQSDSVVSRNEEDYSIFVDPVNGDDNYSGTEGDWAKAKKTLQSAFDSLPRFNEGTITIWIKSGTTAWTEATELYLVGVSGPGTIIINFQARTAILNGRLNIINCTNHINLQNGSIKNQEVFASTFYRGCLYTECATRVTLNNMYFDARAGAKLAYCIAGFFNSYIQIYSSEAYNALTAQVVSAYGSRIDFQGTGVKGSGGQYGLYVVGSSMLGGVGSQPTGTTGNILKAQSGFCDTTFTTDAGTPPNAGTTSTTTTTWTATSTQSWRDAYGGWRSDNNYVYQGEYSGYGNHRGCAFFNYSDIQSKLSGKTVKNVQLYLSRRAGGTNAAQSVNVYTHNLTSASGTPVLTLHKSAAGSYSVGQAKWITLPNSIGDSLKNGTAKGIALYSSTGSPYMTFNGGSSVQLKITYEG